MQRVSSLQLVPITVITPTPLNMLRKSTSSSYISSESETDTKVQTKSKLIPSATDLGKRVVFHSSQNKKEKYGTLRYWGTPEFAPGHWCGVELDESKGKNNGSVHGIRYFSCLSNYGVFVPLNRVGLDPTGQSKQRAKTQMPSFDSRTKKLSNSSFPYHTIPRSSSISCLFGDPSINDMNSGTSFFPYQNRPEITGMKTNARSNRQEKKTSGLTSVKKSGMKKYTSEVSIPKKMDSKVESTWQIPTKRVRQPPLGSCSELTNQNESIRSYESCYDLSTLVANRRTLSINDSPPRTSTPTDSEDGLSCYSSTSDLSSNKGLSTSDSDATPRSSSTSPCFLDVDSASISDNAFILTPPVTGKTSSHSPTHTSYSPSHTPPVSYSPTHKVPLLYSPSHKVPLPLGLSTQTTSLIETSRQIGNRECMVSSPESHQVNKRYQNGKLGLTLDHPLINGLVANGGYCDVNTTIKMISETMSDGNIEDEIDQDLSGKTLTNCNEIFVCPNSGQEIPTGNTIRNSSELLIEDLQGRFDLCFKQQVAMETRIIGIEESIQQLQLKFTETLEQVQNNFIKQIEEVNDRHKTEMQTLTKSHDQELLALQKAHVQNLEDFRQEILQMKQ